MTDEQIQQAAWRCYAEATALAMPALDGDVSATATAILVEALKQATPELSESGRRGLFDN